MELHVSVDEADVGSVQVGQEASFTVDAYPNRRFSAHITQVHFASSNTKSSRVVERLQSGERDVHRRCDLRDRARSGQSASCCCVRA